MIKQHTQSIIPVTYKYTVSVYLRKNTSYKNSSQLSAIQTFNEAVCVLMRMFKRQEEEMFHPHPALALPNTLT